MSKLKIHVGTCGNGVTIHQWSDPEMHVGLSTITYISPAQAEKLAADLLDAVRKIPRVACGADLGIEVAQ
jgi:hypothetical protein